MATRCGEGATTRPKGRTTKRTRRGEEKGKGKGKGKGEGTTGGNETNNTKGTKKKKEEKKEDGEKRNSERIALTHNERQRHEHWAVGQAPSPAPVRRPSVCRICCPALSPVRCLWRRMAATTTGAAASTMLCVRW
jgi:hypothetical protein